MISDEQEIDGFISGRNKKTKRSISFNPKYLLFAVPFVPVLAILITPVIIDHYFLQKTATSTGKVQLSNNAASRTGENPRVTTFTNAGRLLSNGDELALSRMKSMSTNQLATKLKSSSSESIQQLAEQKTGRRISDSKIKKAQRAAGNSSIVRRANSARQTYGGSPSSALADIRSKLNR